MLDGRGIEPRWGKTYFLFTIPIQTRPEIHPAFFPVGAGVKWPGRGVDQVSPSVVEVNNEWIFSSTPPPCLVWHVMGCTLHVSTALICQI